MRKRSGDAGDLHRDWLYLRDAKPAFEKAWDVWDLADGDASASDSAADVAEVIVSLTGKKGEEPEIPLSLLEDFAAKHSKPDAPANAVITWAKTDQPGAVAPAKAALAKALKGRAFRVLRYVTRIWDRYLEEHPRARKLPAVVPLVCTRGTGAGG